MSKGPTALFWVALILIELGLVWYIGLDIGEQRTLSRMKSSFCVEVGGVTQDLGCITGENSFVPFPKYLLERD